MKKFIRELERRNVLKGALAYLVVAWLLTQVLAIVIPVFDLPKYILRYSIIGLAIVFPFWVIFSWVYELTPSGIKKTHSVLPEHSILGKTSNRLNYVIIAALVLAIGLLIRNGRQHSTNAIATTDVTPVETDKSIAVLAFADMSPHKDQEYFSDGISEEILNLLTKVPDLKVISRTSSFSYKDKEVDITKIGKELHVEHILEGSIRKSGNTFRISAKLIDAQSGTDIWSETYDRKIEDIFKVQDEIAAIVTQKLKISLFGTEITSTRVNTDAYSLFLEANQLYYQFSAENTTTALKLVQESIAIDSQYAPSWALLGALYYLAGSSFGIMTMEEATRLGTEAEERAIKLDPKYARSYLGLAKFKKVSWDFEQAEQLLDKAVLLNPHNPRVIASQADFAIYTGKPKLALEMILKTIELDPLEKMHYWEIGLYYWINEDYAKAEESMNHYLMVYPSSGAANGLMGGIQLSRGHPKKGLEYIMKQPDPFWQLYRKCMIVYALGDKKKADELLLQLIDQYGHDSWPNIACVYAYRGERDQAFKWLDLAYKNKDATLLEVLNYPECKNLWGDPRWNKLINKLGLPKGHGFHLDPL